MGEEMHPNWRALATAPFPYKQFVKATHSREETQAEKKEEFNNENLRGEEVMNFYNKLIKEEVKKEEPAIKEEPNIKVEPKEEIVISDDDSDDEICVVDPRLNQKLLTAAQNGNIGELKKLLSSGGDIDVLDEFGWTPLMVAGAEGHEETVSFLLDRGAKPDVADKSGRTAVDIARTKAKFGVEEILENFGKFKSNRNQQKTEIKGVELESCGICGEIYSAEKKKDHQASMVHQMELDKLQDEGNPGFIISETNRGYQLMRKGGWDGHSGLGGHKEGCLFPVKSVLKADREGFKEGARKCAKVTHFTANDEKSVSLRIQKKVPARDARNPVKEVQLRQSLGDL